MCRTVLLQQDSNPPPPPRSPAAHPFQVGDPFKDTAGPSIHVLIKMLATITLVMAPLFLD